MPCGPTQDGWVMVENFDKTVLNSMKGQKDRTLKGELLRLVGPQYAIGYQWRNNSRKNEEMEPNQIQHSVVGVSGDGSKV